ALPISIAPQAQRPRTPVLLSPRHRSTAPERDVLRTLLGSAWGPHDAAVGRAFAGTSLLGGAESAAAHADLVAVRAYLHSREGPLNHGELARALRSGERERSALSYAACLVSGLGRLAAYRGAVLRGSTGRRATPPRPGQVVRDPAPVSGLPVGAAAAAEVPGAAYAIWSITGRQVDPLLASGEEVVFAPGSAFRVLDVRSGDGGPLVLLRQLPHTETAAATLEDADETALTQLDQALAGLPAPGSAAWPARCAGPVGAP
ncbi:hypothetical protein OK074_8725, partial [Actinobacteria bacterium OK074]